MFLYIRYDDVQLFAKDVQKMYTDVHIVLYSYYIHTCKMYTNIHEKVQTTEYDKQIIECVNKQPFYTEKNNTNWSSEKNLSQVFIMPSEIEDRIFTCLVHTILQRQIERLVQHVQICTFIKIQKIDSNRETRHLRQYPIFCRIFVSIEIFLKKSELNPKFSVKNFAAKLRVYY